MPKQLELWGENQDSEQPTDNRTLDEKALDCHRPIHALLRSTRVPIGLREIQLNLQHPAKDARDPLSNPVNRILKWMRDAGEIVAHEPEHGEPSFTLRQYSIDLPPIELTAAADSPRDTAGRGVESSKESPAPRLVRPDRQIVFDGKPHYDWPQPAMDRDIISVDRVSDDIDGPAHRFFIHRYDYVEVFFSSSKVDYGYVVGISHAREEVGVSFQDPPTRESMIWFPVGCIYPSIEPSAPEREVVPPSNDIDEFSDQNAPEQEFADAKQIPSTEETSSSKNPNATDMRSLQQKITSQLQSAADSLSVTMNTFLQGAWALLLSHYGGHQDGRRRGSTGIARYAVLRRRRARRDRWG